MPDSAKQAFEEDDLDDLDDYLDEFQDEILSKPADVLAKENNEAKSKASGQEYKKNPAEKLDANTSELNDDELAGQMEGILKELQAESPEAKLQFEDMVKKFASFEGELKKDGNKKEEEKNPANLKDTISSTLNRLKESGTKVDQSIKDEEPDQLLENMLKKLSMGDKDGANGEDFDIGNLLGELLDQLASKSVIYEPLKDLSGKYPEWIKNNREGITSEELGRYTLQSEIVQSIVAKFEEESYTDESKSHKEFISQKLEEMQNSGNPPEDLMGDLSKTGLPGFQFDGNSLPDDFGGDIEKELEENCQVQ